VYLDNGAQRYEQFLEVGRLYKALILLGLALLLFEHLSIFDLCGAIYIVNFLVTSFSLPFSELSLVVLKLQITVSLANVEKMFEFILCQQLVRVLLSAGSSEVAHCYLVHV